MSKAAVINLIALLLAGAGFFLHNQPLLYTGLFALSGALTNHLAVYMLFEKVPFLYGSGVIEQNFEKFKLSIKNLIMTQFFTKEQLDAFFATEEKKINLVPIVEKTDFSIAFDALSKSVMESSFGSMLGMFGGESALEGLREPFTDKIQSAVIQIVSSKPFEETLAYHLQNSSLSDDVLEKIETLITNRLNELSASMVKEIVHNLIAEHLGWLVVWGGVFGGVIGLLSSFLV